MNTKKFGKYLLSVIQTVAGACILSYSVYTALVLGDFSHLEENAIVENFQVILLAVACLAFVCYLFLKGVKYRAILAFFAFLYYSFIMRELDFENFGLDERIVFFFDGVGRNTIAVVVFTSIFLWAICTDFKGYLREALKITFSKWGALMLLFLIFVAIGQIFEHICAGGMANLGEEVPETVGYLGFALCAIDPLGMLNKLLVFEKSSS